MQTTTQTEYIDKLLGKLDDEKARVRTLRLKIIFLEERLEQREQKTVSHYNKILPQLKGMRDKIFKIFLEIPAQLSLTHQEIIQEFSKRYPMINTKNIPRRVRELVEEGKLWSKQDPDSNKARFYLKLKDLKGGESSVE